MRGEAKEDSEQWIGDGYAGGGMGMGMGFAVR